jgi:hypothetical protein
LLPGIHSADREESLSIQNGKGMAVRELTGPGGQRDVAGEAAGLRHGLGGFGEEAPEDVKVVRIDGEQPDLPP